MSNLIKLFLDNSYLEFGKGNFDNWCVFYYSPHGKKTAPRDIEYFDSLIKISEKYDIEVVYNDFVWIYKHTTNRINTKTLSSITALSDKYNNDRLKVDKLFTILYAGMIAEENKENAILKKRIKRLGVYQVLMEEKSAEFAANFSRGRTWHYLDKHCQERGF